MGRTAERGGNFFSDTQVKGSFFAIVRSPFFHAHELDFFSRVISVPAASRTFRPSSFSTAQAAFELSFGAADGELGSIFSLIGLCHGGVGLSKLPRLSQNCRADRGGFFGGGGVFFPFPVLPVGPGATISPIGSHSLAVSFL